MKHNDVPNITYTITPHNYENIFNVYEDSNGMYLYNMLRTINFPSDLDASFYDIYETVTGDTWTNISWKRYGTIKLWWAICAANQINNAVQQPVPGTKLKLLKTNTLRTIISMLEES